MSGGTFHKYVFSTNEFIHYRFPTHTNDLVMDRAEATTSEAFTVILEPGEAPPLHVHHDTEQVFYVLKGAGELHVGDAGEQHFQVKPGDLVRIPPSTWHQILCKNEKPLVYLSIDCFLNGRPKDEPTWESHVKVMCETNGWDIDKVRTL
jgi:mannose-6-phosphate isomerase-like protein (cupin superfamily)